MRNRYLLLILLVLVYCCISHLSFAQELSKEGTVSLSLRSQDGLLRLGKAFMLQVVVKNEGESDVTLCSKYFYGPFTATVDNKLLNLKAETYEEVLIELFPERDNFFVLKPNEEKTVTSYEYKLEKGVKTFNNVQYEGYFLGFNGGYYVLGKNKQVRYRALYRVYEPDTKQAIKFGVENFYQKTMVSNRLDVNIED